jgi:hypothetical protein
MGYWTLPARGYLSFFRCHLFPEDFQITLNPEVSWISVQRLGEPAIGGGQITIYAVSGGVHGSEQGLCFGIRLSGSYQ